MGDLAKKLKFTRGRGTEVGELWAVKLNSGKFGVRWDRTKRVLEQCGMDMKVVGPEEEEQEEDRRKGRKRKVEETVPTTIATSAAEERRPETGGEVGRSEAPTPKVADEAETSPVVSKKWKKTKSEAQAPEVESQAHKAETLKSDGPDTSSVHLQSKEHKKSKGETDEPRAATIADSRDPTEKKRRNEMRRRIRRLV